MSHAVRIPLLALFTKHSPEQTTPPHHHHYHHVRSLSPACVYLADRAKQAGMSEEDFVKKVGLTWGIHLS